MPVKFGVEGIEKEGVFFTEHTINSVISNFGPIEVKLSGQNKGPGSVNKKMAKLAIKKGANAVMQYACDQKSHRWWEQAFTLKWDSEGWHGKGIAVKAQE